MVAAEGSWPKGTFRLHLTTSTTLGRFAPLSVSMAASAREGRHGDVGTGRLGG
jgi:hypothetical protein